MVHSLFCPGIITSYPGKIQLGLEKKYLHYEFVNFSEGHDHMIKSEVQTDPTVATG